MAKRRLDAENIVQCSEIAKSTGKRCERRVECPPAERAQRLPSKNKWGLKNGKWYCPLHYDG